MKYRNCYGGLVMLLAIATFANAQQLKPHPLSRDDSARVVKYQNKVEEFLTLSDKKTASDWINRIAFIYWNHNIFSEAAHHYEWSLKLNKELGNENGAAMINSNLGFIYSDIGDYKKAQTYLEKTLAARRAKKERIGMISALINLSVVLNNLNEFRKSVDHLEEALELARELNDAKQMKSCYGMLSETYEKSGNAKRSFYYFQLYKTFHEMVQEIKIKKVESELENERLRTRLVEMDKRNKELELRAKEEELREKDSTNQELFKNLTKKEMQLRLTTQEAKIRSLQAAKEHEKDIRKLEIEQREKRNLIFILAVFVLVLLITYYLNRKIVKANVKLGTQNGVIRKQQRKILKQNEKLEVATAEITASINYAAMIQSASLFHQEHLSELLPDSFIFFMPKDVVSGDFYWYNQIGGKLIIAAVDCTGHGVPGGFMSMIANNLLSDIILNQKELEPVTILQKTDDGIRQALNQRFSGNKDGMDMALCIIDKSEGKIRYAGAKNPMLLIQEKTPILVKPTRRSMGGYYQADFPDFKQEEISLKGENHIYLYSDGFQDQFGGGEGRKYGNQRFRNFLFKNHELPYEEQHKALSEELKEWKNGDFQIDDLLVIGVKISLA